MVIEDVPRVAFIVTEAEVGVDGESEGMKALAAHLTGVSCGWLLVVLLLELGVECIVGFVDGEKIADVSLREMFGGGGFVRLVPAFFGALFSL